MSRRGWVALAALAERIAAAACLAADSSAGIVYILGTPKGDYSLGVTSDWNAQALWPLVSTRAGTRPDFTPGNTQCHLAQYTNKVVVINGDSTSSQNIHTFDYVAGSWEMTAASGAVQPREMSFVLDHDTLVLYGVYQQQMHFINMNPPPPTASWTLQNYAPYSLGPSPVVGFSQNHLFYFNNPQLAPGQAYVYVIHYAYWQPEIITFQGPPFPQTPGKTAIIPVQSNSVPLVFAFIPDDYSGTFILNGEVTTNSSRLLPPPAVKDLKAQYAATATHLLQLTSSYQVWAIDHTAASSSWTQIAHPVLASLAGFDAGSGTGSVVSISASGSTTMAVTSAAATQATSVAPEASGTSQHSQARSISIVETIVAPALFLLSCLL
ncbi:hypothetical protein HDV03_005289 [Kappamyces sp. JEL0829]|nr:hypothetical protein HDV03_005289 [Kappamyces sp. JEL0829]